MRTSNLLFTAVLAATTSWLIGCATPSDDEPGDDGSGFELAPEPDPNVAEPDPGILIGCSNQQISSAQNACRNTFCGTRGSNGIHFCDQRPAQGIVVAQCDCRSGADPTIQCSLLSCPQ